MNQMLLDFGNQWIFSPIEFCCLFSQVLMVGIKNLLERWRSNNGGERCDLWSVQFQTKPLEKKDVCCGPTQMVFIPLGCQRSFMGGTVALAKTGRIWRFLAGCFGWVRGCRSVVLSIWLHSWLTVLESLFIVRLFLNSNSKHKRM